MRIDVNHVAGVDKGPKTAAGIRDVDLDDEAIAALIAQKPATFVAGEHVWLNPRTREAWGTDAQLRKTLWQPLCDRAGVRYRNPYQVRHTPMPSIESPLRYPGGKTQLAPFVVDLLDANDLLNGVYAEPFAGGAGLAWRLLLSGRVSEVWLNDIDPGIHSFWKAVLTQSDALCELIETTPVTMKEWQRQREILMSSRPRQLDLAFATLFLNRTNRSGIIARGGVIGGKDQTGPYKIDCRFYRQDLIDKICRIATYRDVVRLSRLDAGLCIPQWAKTLPKRALMNIDPPYFAKGQELYTNFYGPDDHKALARIIRKLKCSWMLTYDDEPAIQKLYAGLPMYRKGLVYSAQIKRRASELLVLAPHVAPPAGFATEKVAA